MLGILYLSYKISTQEVIHEKNILLVHTPSWRGVRAAELPRPP
jgi:hypothetical protein